MALLTTRGLTKDFGGGKGILDLDLSVGQGVVHGFLGPNGAGKTTTLRLLMDYLRPDRGEARILGRDPRTDADWIRARVGYIPGELALPGHLTGRRFLDDSAAVRDGVDQGRRSQLVETLGAQLDAKIRTLSKGNRQKIALVDALQHNPRVLILDEPTDGLDPLLRHRVQRILRDHARRGGTVFLSSHVVHEIQTTCDEVSIVINARLQRKARVDELLAREPVRVEATVPDLVAARARLSQVPGIQDLRRTGSRVRFQMEGPLLAAMQALLELQATDVVARHDLEDTFLRIYGEADA